MSITFGAGITVGPGVSVTPSAPVNLRFDTNYLGSLLGTAFNDIGLNDGGPGVFTGLTTLQMSSTGKYMISWALSYSDNPYNQIGIANRSVNLESYLGSDTNGIGFAQDGSLYYNGTAISTGLPTWGLGDIVDLAVDNSTASMWIRVNGSNWNNSPTANPSTNTEGIETIAGQYFAGTIGGESGPSELIMQLQPVHAAPVGFEFWGPGPTFTITSSRVSNPGAFDGDFTDVSTNGYILVGNGDAYSSYYVTITDNDSDIIAAFDAAGELYTQSYPGYIWIVTWGAGSEVINNVAHVAYNSNNKQFNIVAFDATSDWQAAGANGFAAAGQYYFPATLTAYLPPVEKSGWC